MMSGGMMGGRQMGPGIKPWLSREDPVAGIWAPG